MTQRYQTGPMVRPIRYSDACVTDRVWRTDRSGAENVVVVRWSYHRTEICTRNAEEGSRVSIPDTNPYAPISRETVSSQIRNQLLERISSGDLAPGARMPSERELSERFEVARTSVREAMQGLVSMRVVERRGNRSYVAEHLPEVVVEPSGDGKSFVAELFETRRVLELPIFEMAAERATEEERAKIAAAAAARFHPSLDIGEFRTARPGVPHDRRLRVRKPAADRAVRQGARSALPVGRVFHALVGGEQPGRSRAHRRRLMRSALADCRARSRREMLPLCVRRPNSTSMLSSSRWSTIWTESGPRPAEFSTDWPLYVGSDDGQMVRPHVSVARICQ